MDEYFLKDVFEAAVHLVKSSGGRMDAKAAVKQAFEDYEQHEVKKLRASAQMHMANGKLADLVAESAAGRKPTVDFRYDRIHAACVDLGDIAWKAPKLDPGHSGVPLRCDLRTF